MEHPNKKFENTSYLTQPSKAKAYISQENIISHELKTVQLRNSQDKLFLKKRIKNSALESSEKNKLLLTCRLNCKILTTDCFSKTNFHIIIFFHKSAFLTINCIISPIIFILVDLANLTVFFMFLYVKCAVLKISGIGPDLYFFLTILKFSLTKMATACMAYSVNIIKMSISK